MELNALLVLVGGMMLASIFASRISDILGIPGLLLFIGIGMLAGNDGIVGLHFSNAEATNQFCLVALAFILFAGGMETRWSDVRPIALRGSILATIGVILTAVFLFAATYYILHLRFEVALLLSVIVSSTDAPAVFMIMKNQPQQLHGNLRSLLEFESGSNDPMAVLLSVIAIHILQNSNLHWYNIAEMFVLQPGVGIIIGFIFGRAASWLLKKYRIGNFGLYTVFGVALVLLCFGLTQMMQGSGFLAVYICGIVLRNSVFLYRRNLIKFHDSIAWIMQIFIFLLLGIFVNPGALPAVLPISLSCAFFLIFAARPLAVYICLWGSSFSGKEKFFISWAGLKGAVPIILATYPLMMGFPNSQFLFNLIFFLVIISVLLQGKLLPFWAHKLHLYEKRK